jgi:hypothetical protein
VKWGFERAFQGGMEKRPVERLSRTAKEKPKMGGIK